MRFLLNLITDLGDSALLLPASGLLIAYLLYFRTVDLARIWLSTLALCACLTLVLKVVFFTCGTEVPLAVHNPSGHTSLSMTFYGCAAVMLTGDKGRAAQISMLAAGALLVLAVAISRVLLHDHTLSEVMLGLSVGIICVAWFCSRFLALPRLSLPWRPGGLPWRSGLAAIALLLIVTHGTHWSFEWAVSRLAALLRATAPICT